MEHVVEGIRSGDREPGVYGDGLPGHVGGLVRREERRQAGDLGGVGDAFEPCPLSEVAGDALGLEHFSEKFSNWYLRRSRRRFWRTETDRDKACAYQTLFEVLTTLTGLMAPILPFLAEEMHQNLVRSSDPTAAETVHLTDYPQVDPALRDETLEVSDRVTIEYSASDRIASAVEAHRGFLSEELLAVALTRLEAIEDGATGRAGGEKVTLRLTVAKSNG